MSKEFGETDVDWMKNVVCAERNDAEDDVDLMGAR